MTTLSTRQGEQGAFDSRAARPIGTAGTAQAADPELGWRTRNVGRLLFVATDHIIRHKLAIINAGGFADLTAAQTALFLNLDRDGTRLTTLAARARLTKQSIIELVDRAEALALVTRRPDLDDRRAKIVVLTPRGARVWQALRRASTEAERRVAEVIGSEFLSRVKDELYAYAVRPISSEQPPRDEVEPASSDRAVGRIFGAAARRFAREALDVVQEGGFGDVTEALLALFRNLDLGGTRLTDIALRSRMTKQSMRELVDRAQMLGFTDRRADPDDGRAKIITFTARGLAMLEEVRRGIAHAERRMGRITGNDFLTDLKCRLAEYNASVDRGETDSAGRRAVALGSTSAGRVAST